VATHCKVPVVFISTYGFDDDARPKASSGGAVAYLRKPFGEDELLDAISEALKLKSTWKDR
jgi:FixJ family two-component response regulator